MLVGQIRSTAMDLLCASGMDYAESQQALREGTGDQRLTSPVVYNRLTRLRLQSLEC
jgi:hypothetical protein